jgi:hypothetical protein
LGYIFPNFFTPIEQPLETVPSSEQQQESVTSSELSSSSENEPSKDTESLKETLDIDKSVITEIVSSPNSGKALILAVH